MGGLWAMEDADIVGAIERCNRLISKGLHNGKFRQLFDSFRCTSSRILPRSDVRLEATRLTRNIHIQMANNRNRFFSTTFIISQRWKSLHRVIIILVIFLYSTCQMYLTYKCTEKAYKPLILKI